MIIMQIATSEITINRLDTGEQLILLPGKEVWVDEKTGNYLINMRCFNENGELASNFIKIS